MSYKRKKLPIVISISRYLSTDLRFKSKSKNYQTEFVFLKIA